MMKLVFLALAVYSVTCVSPPITSYSKNICETYGGQNLYTFSGKRSQMKIPCKYHAIRDTICENFKVTITPGNDVELKGRRYRPSGLWLRVEDLDTGRRYEGRTNYNVSNKWIQGYGKTAYPFIMKDGSKMLDEIFTIAKPHTGNYVTLTSFSGNMKIGFYMYDPYIRKSYKDSGFSFSCSSDTFLPTNYPDQICGSGMKFEEKKFAKQLDFDPEDKDTLLVHTVFSNHGLEQVDRDCQAATNAMSKRCKTIEKQYEAAQLCGSIFTDKRTRKCIMKREANIKSAFRHCVEYVCSGGKDKNACLAYSSEAYDCNRPLKNKHLKC